MTDQMHKAHDYLSRIQSLAYKVDAINEALADLESRNPAYLRATQYDAIKVQTSGGDPMLNYIATADRYKSDLLATKAAYLDSQKEAIARINRLHDGLNVDILTRRYVLGQTWATIAININYSERGARFINHRALKEFYEVNRDLWPSKIQ